MSKANFTESANLVISMLQTVGGTKNCNPKTVSNLLRALPTIPKNAVESGISYWGEYSTADKAINAYKVECAKQTTDQSVLVGLVIDAAIKQIENVCNQITDDHFNTDRPGRSEGSTKVTFGDKEYSTGEYLPVFGNNKLNDILNPDDSARTESYAKMLRYASAQLKKLADEILPPAKRTKNDEAE